MSKVAVSKEKIVAVADAIREKTETSEGLGLDAMPQAIRDIKSGGADFAIDNAEHLFYNGARLEQYENIAPLLKDVYSMRYMFARNSTTEVDPLIDFSKLDTSKVRFMSYMFQYYPGRTLDLSSFDTGSVTNMEYMFANTAYCNYIIFGDKFDVSKVGSMKCMFSQCNAVAIDVSKFDTDSATDMNNMFFGCKYVKELDVSNFDTASVRDMASMFGSCEKIEELDLSSFDTKNVTTMQSMFNGCKSLTKLDLSSFDTSKVTAMNSMFSNCSKLEEIVGFSAINKAGISISFPYGSSSSKNALKRLTFKTDLPSGTYSIRSAINISHCAFERSGMVEMFNSLPDISGISVSANYKKITITGNPCLTGTLADGTACETLTDADRAIATSKGWTLVE